MPAEGLSTSTYAQLSRVIGSEAGHCSQPAHLQGLSAEPRHLSDPKRGPGLQPTKMFHGPDEVGPWGGGKSDAFQLIIVKIIIDMGLVLLNDDWPFCVLLNSSVSVHA